MAGKQKMAALTGRVSQLTKSGDYKFAPSVRPPATKLTRASAAPH
jgi:hypothetical protein